MNQFTLHHGDCLEALKAMPDHSVDSIVTDPPYGLTTNKNGGTGVASVNLESPYGRARIGVGNGAGGFMGHKWDSDVPSVEIWTECLRVLKPGGHLLAFAGTRTQHRMATRIEDAGFEIRDMIAWVYSSGFPKSHNIDNHRGSHVCGCAVPYTHAKTQPDNGRAGGQRAGVGVEDCAQAECDVRPVLVTHVPQAESVGKECREVLQPSLQEQGPSIAGREQLPAPEDRTRQPRMEGRCDASEATGKLCAGALCQSARMDCADGTTGRLCDGASASDDAVVRLSSDANGVRPPFGPQPTEQRPQQPGAMAGQPKPQAGGAWPVCGGCGLPVVPRGLGTALKPALEPITVARKPLVGTVAANVLAHGTGALNIDGCRVETNEKISCSASAPYASDRSWNTSTTPGIERKQHDGGRWPANLIHDGSDEVLSAFPDAKGQQGPISATAPSEKTSNVYGRMKREGEASASSDNQGAVGFKMRPGMRRLDEGSAARFFYCAKASRKDRNEGLTSSSTPAVATDATMRDCQTADRSTRNGNHHPTVKPTDLMRYLCRLVTPPGGVVLDPFMGSGSTGKAAVLEGFRFVGCELSADYLAIARHRIEHALALSAPQAGEQMSLLVAEEVRQRQGEPA